MHLCACMFNFIDNLNIIIFKHMPNLLNLFLLVLKLVYKIWLTLIINLKVLIQRCSHLFTTIFIMQYLTILFIPLKATKSSKQFVFQELCWRFRDGVGEDDFRYDCITSFPLRYLSGWRHSLLRDVTTLESPLSTFIWQLLEFPVCWDFRHVTLVILYQISEIKL